MKSFYLAIAILLFSPYLSAQENITLKKSQIFKDDTKASGLSLSENDGKGGFIILRSYGKYRVKGYYITHYSSDLKVIEDGEIEVNKSLIEGMVVKDNQIHLIEFAKKNKEYVYNVLTSPMNNFNFKRKKLLSINSKLIKKGNPLPGVWGLIGANQMDKDAFGKVTFSKNKHFFTITFDVKDKEKENHKIYVFDDDFKVLYRTNFSLKIKDRLFDFQDIDVDDIDGTVYFTGKAYENKKRRAKRKGKPNYHFEIYKINKDGKKKLSFKCEKHFVGAVYSLHNEGNLTCVGFYSDKNSFKYKGVFRYNIDPADMSIKNSVFLPFSNQFLMDKYGKVKHKELRNISFRKVFLDTNGDIIINGEEFYVTERHSQVGAVGIPRKTFHFDDIIAAKINKEGKLAWARNINKRQILTSFDVHSYFSAYVNGKNYFFINISDKIKRIRKNRIQFKGKNPKRSNLYVVVIDEKGNFEYKKLLDDKENAVPFSVRSGRFLGKKTNEFVFLGRKRSKKQLLKVTIN